MSRALGTCCLMLWYCRMSGVAASLMGSGADPRSWGPLWGRRPRRLVHHGEADFVGEKRGQGGPRRGRGPPGGAAAPVGWCTGGKLFWWGRGGPGGPRADQGVRPTTLVRFCNGILMLGVEAAEFDGLGDAVQGQHVGGDAIVDFVGAGILDDGVEAFVHDLLEAVVDQFFVPEET